MEDDQSSVERDPLLSVDKNGGCRDNTQKGDTVGGRKEAFYQL